MGCSCSLDGENAFCSESLPPAELPNSDQRQTNAAAPTSLPALARLRAADFPMPGCISDSIVGSPRWIMSPSGFLTGPNGIGPAISHATLSQFAANDSNRVLRAFLLEHRDLFGHDAAALDAARVKREFIGARNGLRTTVWEQQLDGISVFDSLFISHLSAKGELVSLSSEFVPAPDTAAGGDAASRSSLESAPPVTSSQAVLAAANNIGEKNSPEKLSASPCESTPEKRQSFTAPNLKGNATARLVWLPLNRDSLRLCWEVTPLMGRARDQMFRVIVDAQTGRALLRHCLTADISAASYRVFNSFNPTPFLSPSNSLPTIMGYSSPANKSTAASQPRPHHHQRARLPMRHPMAGSTTATTRPPATTCRPNSTVPAPIRPRPPVRRSVILIFPSI